MNPNPYAPPATEYRCKRPLLYAHFKFGLLAIFLSCAAGICVAFGTQNMLITAAFSLSFLSIQCALTAAACWLVDRLSVEQPSRLPVIHSTTEEAP